MIDIYDIKRYLHLGTVVRVNVGGEVCFVTLASNYNTAFKTIDTNLGVFHFDQIVEIFTRTEAGRWSSDAQKSVSYTCLRSIYSNGVWSDSSYMPDKDGLLWEEEMNKRYGRNSK